MSQIYFGDNLEILKGLSSESVDLIYIDPPFNTKKTQKRTTIRTMKDENGDRRGFKGNTYRTVELGTKFYKDTFDSYIDGFLRPRLVEAYRILKSHGSLYFHIDYREVHYCKLLLDEIFGRESFLNEIIWAYDYGGRAKSKWPAKHDNILYYVKDPQKYTFNRAEIDKEPYMAPGLVSPQKAREGKMPTDTWWASFTGIKKARNISDTWWLSLLGQNDTWWKTIVPTNSKERIGYPTQKPRALIDRIIKASTYMGDVVLDFFAGSGTVGESCVEFDRNFILIDNNHTALEVMAQRFSVYEDIEWINFDPKPYQIKSLVNNKHNKQDGIPKLSKEFIMFAATASYLQKEIEEEKDPWKNSPIEWIINLPPRKKGKLGGDLIATWLASKGEHIESAKDQSETLVIKGYRFAIKLSTLWAKGYYKFQQIRTEGYDYVLCFGVSPFEVHCWIFERQHALNNATQQHKGTKGSEYWITIKPNDPPKWARGSGGTLEEAYKVLKKIKPNNIKSIE
jgi:site-specific DNA-methyltransferase (adenine-specific)